MRLLKKFRERLRNALAMLFRLVGEAEGLLATLTTKDKQTLKPMLNQCVQALWRFGQLAKTSYEELHFSLGKNQAEEVELMTIEDDLYRQIRRLHTDRHSQRKIARITGSSRKTVKKYCQGAVLPDAKRIEPEVVDPPLKKALEAKILNMLEENKTLPRKQRRTAKDIWQELKKKGFDVAESTIRRYVHNLRNINPGAYVPLDFKSGETMQVDWGDMKDWMDGVKTGVSVFMTILPCSFAPYASVFPDKTNACFLSGHIRAFGFYGGVVKRQPEKCCSQWLRH